MPRQSQRHDITMLGILALIIPAAFALPSIVKDEGFLQLGWAALAFIGVSLIVVEIFGLATQLRETKRPGPPLTRPPAAPLDFDEPWKTGRRPS